MFSLVENPCINCGDFCIFNILNRYVMTKNELRIGNLVLTENSIANLMDITAVESIQHDGINITDGIGNTYETEFCFNLIQPILLTEEWLLKFGLKYDKNEETTFLIPYSFYINYEAEDDYCIYENVNDSFITSLEYVHQLQNLYFALTGEELEVKETAIN